MCDDNRNNNRVKAYQVLHPGQAHHPQGRNHKTANWISKGEGRGEASFIDDKLSHHAREGGVETGRQGRQKNEEGGCNLHHEADSIIPSSPWNLFSARREEGGGGSGLPPSPEPEPGRRRENGDWG